MSNFRKKGGLPEGHNWEDYYLRFNRAKSHQTLDIMYRAAEKSAQTLCYSEQINSWILIDIYFAYSKRQEELDSTVVLDIGKMSLPSHSSARGLSRVSRQTELSVVGFNQRFRQEQEHVKDLSPEQQMSYMLKQMSIQ